MRNNSNRFALFFVIWVFILLLLLSGTFSAEGCEFYHDDGGSYKEAECLYSEEDLRMMSAIIWCEAGNQCMAGKEAVGIVVMNRMESEWWSDTVTGVIFDEGQFSPAMSGWIYDALYMYDTGALPKECILAARYALNGNKSIKYGDYIYDMSSYYFFGLYREDCRLQIQDHQFA